MREERQFKTNGLTGVELLQVAFIVLKLCNVIKWSWVWVLAPAWISILVAIIIGVVIILVDDLER